MSDIVFNVLSITLAGGSLIVAIIAICKSAKAQKEANSAQQRLVEIEEQRETVRQQHAKQAALRPSLRKTDRAGYRLSVFNDGESEARSISVLMDGVRLDDHCSAVHGSQLPTMVGPNSEVSCLLAFSHQCAPPFGIELAWEDDSGTPGSYKGVLTF